MDDTAPSKRLEDCRALCKQLLSGTSLRRTSTDSDTVCVGSIDSVSSFSLRKINIIISSFEIEKINVINSLSRRSYSCGIRLETSA